jgi:putative transport protein
VFAGATTNTPSLAAAQAAIQSVPGSNPASGDFLGRAYAVAYPFGIIGIILTMLLVRRIFSIDVDAEARRAALSTGASERAPDFIDLQVSNPKWMVSPSEICLLPRKQVSSSHNGKVTVPEDDSLIQIDDGLRLVGPRAKLLEFEPSSASR